MNKVKIAVFLEKNVVLKLKSLAKFSNKSTSFIKAVIEYIAKKIPKKKIGIIGIINSNDPHFAENDEEYLKKKNFSIIGIASSSEYSDIANKKGEYLKGFGED